MRRVKNCNLLNRYINLKFKFEELSLKGEELKTHLYGVGAIEYGKIKSKGYKENYTKEELIEGLDIIINSLRNNINIQDEFLSFFIDIIGLENTQFLTDYYYYGINTKILSAKYGIKVNSIGNKITTLNKKINKYDKKTRN